MNSVVYIQKRIYKLAEVFLPDDIKIWSELKKGDIKAFEYFYNKYFEDLCSFAFGFIGNVNDAQDIVQETFVYIWKNRETIEMNRDCAAYLLQITKHKCLNHIKHSAVQQKYEEHKENCDKFNDNSDYSIDDIKELQLRIKSALDKLPSKCREIFLLNSIEGMKYKDIANKLDISENTVKTQVKIAYKKLRNDKNISISDMQILLLILYHQSSQS